MTDDNRCGAVYPYAWDVRGSFVCKKLKGHAGIHRGRGQFTWVTESQGKEEPKKGAGND